MMMCGGPFWDLLFDGVVFFMLERLCSFSRLDGAFRCWVVIWCGVVVFGSFVDGCGLAARCSWIGVWLC